MKLSNVMFFAVGLVTLATVVAVTGWLTPLAGRAVADQAVVPEAFGAAAESAMDGALEEASDEFAAVDDLAQEAEPFEFVGLHAGELLCDPSDFNLGLGGLDGSVRVRHSYASYADVVRIDSFDAVAFTDLSAAAVPEPMTLAMLVMGGTAAFFYNTRRGT